MARLTLAQFLAKAIGAPWQPRGRDYRGMDCWSVVFCAYRDVLGIDLPTYTEASPADVDDVARLVGEHAVAYPWRRVGRSDQRLYDVALFRTDAEIPTHCGLVLQPFRMLHIRRGCLAEVASFSDHDHRGRLWAGRLASIHRHAEAA